MLSPVAAISLLLALGSAVDVCFPLGPTYPPPRTPSKTRALARALDTFNSTITESLTANGSSYGQLDPNTTSFSLEIFSLHEGQPLFTYHFSAPEFGNATEGVRKVNSSTVYRLGSMSKLLSVYNFLIAAGDVHFNEPITKYVPELATFAAQHKAALQTNNIDYVSWDEVTVGALASQMAGISREEAFGPVQDADLREALGLPEVTSVNASFCGPTNMQVQVPCTRADFFVDMFAQHPVVPSWHTPIYSNVAFQILSYALENITGKAFNETFQQSIIDPLKLNNTYLVAPSNADLAIIPYNRSWSWYDWNMGEESPAGAYYSNLIDLRAIGKSILNSTLLPPQTTRKWMKPVTFTGSVNVSVGSPWEIIRAPMERNLWLYTKGGHIGSYTSEIILIPEYEIGAAVLTAGVEVTNDVDLLSNLFAEIVVPPLEDASKEEANMTYTGTYTSTATNDTLIVSVDSFPGLLISNWTWNGTDAISLLGTLAGAAPDQEVEVRLWPTTLTAHSASNPGLATKTSWRTVIQKLPLPDYGPFLGNCISWFQVDQLTYGGVGIDEVVFDLNANGTRATGIEARFFRANYTRS